MVTKKKLATTAAATFGVALSSMYVANEMQADVLDLTYGGNASATNPFVTGSGSPLTIGIDQVSSGAWVQWNDEYGGTGRTQPFFTASTVGPMSVDVVQAGDVLDPATFVGRTSTTALGALVFGNVGGGSEFDGTGSAFIACRPRTDLTQLFWFKIDFTQGGPIVYSSGQISTMGETLTVDGGPGVGCDFAVGDVNTDGDINILDVAPFVDLITSSSFQCEADINEDTVVDILDVAPFVDLLTGG